MGRSFLATFIVCCFLVACNRPQRIGSAQAPVVNDSSALAGTWVLNHLSAPGNTFEDLYPHKKPEITFDVVNSAFNGNTSCNNFRGQMTVEGARIHFADPMAMTRMMCPGLGESAFVETLKKVTSYTVSEGNTLNLIMGDMAVMRFAKK